MPLTNPYCDTKKCDKSYNISKSKVAATFLHADWFSTHRITSSYEGSFQMMGERESGRKSVVATPKHKESACWPHKER